MTTTRRAAVMLALVIAAFAILGITARVIAANTPLPVRQGVVQDVPLRVGPSVNLTPDDPGVMRDDPATRTTTATPTDTPSVEPTRPTTADPTTPARRPILRPIPTDGSDPPPVEEFEPLDPAPVNPPVATDTPAPTN